jgi:hypothetical protein
MTKVGKGNGEGTETKLGARPPRGFGHVGNFDQLPESEQDALQEQWEALTPKQQEEVNRRTAHHRYDHQAFLREQNG